MDLGRFRVALPPISIKAETLFDIPTPFGPLHFTNSMLFTLLVDALLVIFFLMATRRMALVPGRLQNVGEVLIEFLLGTVEGTAGRRVGRRIFPLIATLFLFIIVANWSGLLPGVGTVGYCANEGAGHAVVISKTASPPLQEEAATGGLPGPSDVGTCPKGTAFVPYLRAANADLNTTLSMALLAVLIVQVSGVAAHGFGGYLKELLTPIPLAPIHIMGEISRVISLSFRLFGNIFGGEVLVTVMYVLLGSLFLGFGTVIFLGLELLFGFIQALLFSILTLVYIATAVAGHGGGEHGAEDTHSAAPGSFEELGQRAAGAVVGEQGDHKAGGTAQHVGG